MKNKSIIKISVAGLLALSAMFTSAGTSGLPDFAAISYAEDKLLEAPKDIETTVNAVKVKLSWSKVWNAKAYRVLMYDEASKKFKTYKNVSGLKCIVTDLEMGKEYKFRIAALRQNGSKYVMQTPSDIIAVTTKTLKLPKAPSADFTGLANSKGKTYGFEKGKAVVGRTLEVKGKLYLFGESGTLLKGGVHTISDTKYHSDDSGVVTCSKWMTLKDNTYYYAGKDGRITEYSIGSNGKTAAYLKINGEIAKPQDIPYWDSKVRYAYYKIGNDFYRLYMLASGVYAANGDDMLFRNASAYDILTGSQIGTFCGYPIINETFYVEGGRVFNSIDGTIWKFNGKGKLPTQEKAGELIVLRKHVFRNHDGALDFSLDICNNTGKAIKEITYTVYGVDKAGNKVRDTGSDDFNFYLLDSNPVGKRTTSSKEWWSVFKANNATDIEIRGAKVIFSDGSKKILSAEKITIL